MSAALGVIQTFVPLTGRMGWFVWSDLIVAGVVGFFTAVVIAPLAIPLAHRAKNLDKAILSLVLLTLLSVSAMALFVSNPFDQPHPKRLFINHIHQVSTRSTGFQAGDESYLLLGTPDPLHADWVVKKTLQDGSADNSKPTKVLRSLDSASKEHYDGLEGWDAVYPFSYSLQGSTMRYPTPAYPHIAPPRVTILSDIPDHDRQWRNLTVEVLYKGNEWSTLCLDASNVVSWSATEDLPPPNGEGRHFIRHVGGHGVDRWSLSFSLKGSTTQTVQCNVTATHFVQSSTQQMLLQELPPWVTPTAFVTVASTWTL